MYPDLNSYDSHRTYIFTIDVKKRHILCSTERSDVSNNIVFFQIR